MVFIAMHRLGKVEEEQKLQIPFRYAGDNDEQTPRIAQDIVL
jgi:hypothetical protein